MGRRSQEKPGRAKMGQDEPKRRGGSQAEPGGARGAMVSSGEFCWDLEPGGGQEEPGEARKGNDGPG